MYRLGASFDYSGAIESDSYKKDNSGDTDGSV